MFKTYQRKIEVVVHTPYSAHQMLLRHPHTQANEIRMKGEKSDYKKQNIGTKSHRCLTKEKPHKEQ